MLNLPVPRLLPVTMLALAALLALKTAGLLRAVAPAAAADMAQPMPPPPHPAAAMPAAPTEPPPASGPLLPAQAPAPGAPAEAPVSAAERSLLQDLRQRRGELDARDAALAAREAVGRAAERRLAARLDELTALQAQLQALEAARRGREEAGWIGLVRTYEAMKPKDAAAILNDLDLPVLLPVVDRMKVAKAAAVLAAMQPDRARLLTAELSRLRVRENQVVAPAPDAAAPAPNVATPNVPNQGAAPTPTR